jgi:hypothetical protein
MWTEDDPRHPESAYHGLASIAIASVLLLMALPGLLLAFWMQAMNYPGWGADDKRLAAYGGYVGVVVVELLCLFAMSIALRGRGAAARTGEPVVLCTVGLVLSLFAAAVWVGCGVAWHSQAWRFVR